jgi:hypothetical protein
MIIAISSIISYMANLPSLARQRRPLVRAQGPGRERDRSQPFAIVQGSSHGHDAH